MGNKSEAELRQEIEQRFRSLLAEETSFEALMASCLERLLDRGWRPVRWTEHELRVEREDYRARGLRPVRFVEAIAIEAEAWFEEAFERAVEGSKQRQAPGPVPGKEGGDHGNGAGDGIEGASGAGG